MDTAGFPFPCIHKTPIMHDNITSFLLVIDTYSMYNNTIIYILYVDLAQHDGTIDAYMNIGIDYSCLKSDAKCLMPSRSS